MQQVGALLCECLTMFQDNESGLLCSVWVSLHRLIVFFIQSVSFDVSKLVAAWLLYLCDCYIDMLGVLRSGTSE